MSHRPPQHCIKPIIICPVDPHLPRLLLECHRYQHLLRLLESSRDYEEQEQVDTAEEYKTTLMSNMALALFHQGEFARSVDWCDKALQLEPSNAKVGPPQDQQLPVAPTGLPSLPLPPSRVATAPAALGSSCTVPELCQCLFARVCCSGAGRL